MITNGIGGANTRTGLIFEGSVDLATFLAQQNGYAVDNNGEVFYQNKLIAQIFKKHQFYRFLEARGVDWKNIISKRLLPDDSIYVIINNTFFIIECKFQQVAGSVDEKLQTCDFKKKQYQKLLSNLNMEVEYVYLLSNWFRKPEYRDVLDYIISVHCRYYFEYIPLQVLGLPISPIFQSQDSVFSLYQGDCNEILKKFKGQFDLIFADPPYFLSNDGLSIQSGKIVSVNKGQWDKGENIDEIDTFNMRWIVEAKEALKPTGSIMISGTYHNIFSLGRILQKLDFKILNIITWQKTNPPPNFSCRYLTHSTEQIIWARKSHKHKHIFNYEILKKLNGDKQMRDVWSFPAIAPWEKANGKHPTQKPLSLLVRLILMASNEDSLICDPFSGSSTTGIAANLLHRKFIGIEQEKEFIQMSIARKNELDSHRKDIESRVKDLVVYKKS